MGRAGKPVNVELSLLSPAKLNLFLHITGRVSEPPHQGYHRLQTMFQLLDWGDKMHFTSNNSGEISLDMPDIGVSQEQNLITRAARYLQHGKRGAHIRVEKRIPAGGGLGGGSSNAATTLLALRALWQCTHTNEELADIGSELGADVPVFVHGHSAWAEGIGDILTPVELPLHWFLVVKPDCQVATAKIFAHQQLTRDSTPITLAAFFRGSTRNDCQKVVRNLYPEVDNALKWLTNFGTARLTGTGACIFASFDDKAQAEAVKAQLPEKWAGYVAQGVNISPVSEVLS